jgi:membrane-associated phospholipid phosphatase
VGTWLVAGQAVSQQSAGEPASTTGSQRDEDALVRELVSGEGDDEDLHWLYSDADEYAPSDVAGSPVPAPALPTRRGGSRREWSPAWRKAGAGNVALVAIGFSASGASALIPPSPRRWRGTNSLDEWGRDQLGPDDYDSGAWARDASDVLFSLEVAFPLLVDSLIVAHWYRESPEVATQLAWITLEGLSLTALLQGPIAGVSSRERPYGRDCGTRLAEDLGDCVGSKRYRSYFSGHTSLSFAAASTTCSHHLRHDLFGSPVADGLTCAVAMSGAATVGMMRIVGRQHYISDVATGALVGMLAGFAGPEVLHYGNFDDNSALASLRVTPSARGLTVGGTF